MYLWRYRIPITIILYFTISPWCTIYSGPVISPYHHGAQFTVDQQAFNKSMSSWRISVEWIFGDILNYFKFLDFKKNLKVGLSAVGKMYLVCALLHNI